MAEYESLLVAGDFETTVDALQAAEHQAIVAPVSRARVVVIPEGGCWRSLGDILTLLSGELGFPVIHWQNDSAVLTADVWIYDRHKHWYVSDQSKAAHRFVDKEGQSKVRLGLSVYPGDTPIPAGPSGDDPAAFVRFGVGDVDVDRLAAALRGDVDHAGPHGLPPDRQHRAILEALNLNPLPLTDEFTRYDRRRLPGAVLVEPPVTDAQRAAVEESVREFMRMQGHPNW